MLRAARVSLRELHLQNLGLKAIPPAIAELSNLELLSFYNNHISNLPAGAYLVNLEVLDVGCNAELHAIPPALAACTNLRLLLLDDCSNIVTDQTAISKRLHCTLPLHS